jgi:putative toxin-antitoxin system antitoxin component (TIGR02293 family)
MRNVLDRKRIGFRHDQVNRRDRRYVSPGASLGLRQTETSDLIEEILAGLSFRTLETFSSESSLPLAEIASLIEIPQRTLARRKVIGKLSSEESERLLRLSRVFEKAVALFEGNVDAAVVWLRRPKRALGHKSPLTYSRTELGARQIEDLIGGLEHGVFA